MLKPGGVALVWTSNKLNYSMLLAALTPTRFHNWVRRLAFPQIAKEKAPTYYRANTPAALARCVTEAGLLLEGGVGHGAGAYHHFRFSKLLFAAAAVGSRIASTGPLRRLKAVLIVRCVKPAPGRGLIGNRLRPNGMGG